MKGWRKKQAEMASRAGADLAAGQAGGPGMMKAEGGWTAEPQPPGGVKSEPKQEVMLMSLPLCAVRFRLSIAEAQRFVCCLRWSASQNSGKKLLCTALLLTMPYSASKASCDLSHDVQ